MITAIAIALAAEASAAHSTEVLDHKVTDFQVQDRTLVEAISVLSFQQIDGLHLGLEEILRDQTSDPASQSQRFSLRLQSKSVREILDAICSKDDRYRWTQDGSTINVYIKAADGDSSYLLNRRLGHITVSAIPDPEEGLTFLDKQLPPPREQLAYAGAGGDPKYKEPWTQSFEHLTVRQYINRLSEHIGPHSSWVFYGSKQERLFTFVKGGFH